MRCAQEVKPASWQDVCSARVKPLSFYNFPFNIQFNFPFNFPFNFLFNFLFNFRKLN